MPYFQYRIDEDGIQIYSDPAADLIDHILWFSCNAQCPYCFQWRWLVMPTTVTSLECPTCHGLALVADEIEPPTVVTA